jgi:uncharacterized integral membrane protein
VSDPKGETPHPDHPQEDDFSLEFPLQHEEGAPQAESHGQEHAAADAPHPLDALGINSSTDEFHFSGPVEELDFTEPVDFTFPSEPAEAEADSDSSAEIGGIEHAGLEHLLGGEEAAPHEAAEGEAVAEAEPAAEAGVVEAAEEEAETEPQAKPKRELPAWVHTLEWTSVALLAVGALIALFVSIIWVQNPDTVTLVLNISCPLMLALIPYSLWRSSRRWVTPSISALYTVLLAIGAAALIGGTWAEGMELSRYNWQFNKSRLASGRPPQLYFPPADQPADAAK